MKVSRTQRKEEIHFICIDNREKSPDGTIHIILGDGQRVVLPPSVKEVPTLLLLHHGNRTLAGAAEILGYLAPKEIQLNKIATQSNGEPLAFSSIEMGSGLSDNYSYLDMSADELSAKGNGGLRILHSYVQVDQNQVIATPPDDYVPNKVGSVDMDKIMAQRSADIKKR